MKDLRARGALIASALILFACNGSPKSIPEEAGAVDKGTSTGVFSTDGAQTPAAGTVDPAATKELHTVVALETLPTTKYVYVRVKEGDREFWIATLLQEVNIGRRYFYRGGLLKTDLESKEYARTFDELYLISQLVPADHGEQEGGNRLPGMSTPTSPTGASSTSVEGAQPVKISALFADPKKYAGKAVRLSGKVTKVNPNIMGRNWIHLKDGSQDDKDLVITCSFPVAEGSTVTMAGTVVLNKDFGSGYNYDILVENGTLVN